MSEVNTGGGEKVKGKPKKLSTRVDFTPMVDLMFLLLTFFMLATSMIKPQTMEIVMPSKEKTDKPPDKISDKRAVTVILGKNNQLFYYIGTRDKEGNDPQVVVSDYSPKGFRTFLLERNKTVIEGIKKYKALNKGRNIPDSTYRKGLTQIKTEDKKSPVILIKASKDANYGNLVNILDEMNICSIPSYAIVDITGYEFELLKKQNLNQ